MWDIPLCKKEYLVWKQKTCWNLLKCRRSLQSLWIPHWKGLWVFLPIFSLPLYAYLHSVLSSESCKQPFSFGVHAALRAVGCWSMTKAPKCPPNTDNNKSRERSVLRAVHLWLTKWISCCCKTLRRGKNCLKIWKSLRTPVVVCEESSRVWEKNESKFFKGKPISSCRQKSGIQG